MDTIQVSFVSFPILITASHCKEEPPNYQWVLDNNNASNHPHLYNVSPPLEQLTGICPNRSLEESMYATTALLDRFDL